MCVVIVVGAENSPSAVAVRSDCTNDDAVATASAADVAAAVEEEASRASDDAEDAEQQNAGKYLEYNVMIAQFHHVFTTTIKVSVY